MYAIRSYYVIAAIPFSATAACLTPFADVPFASWVSLLTESTFAATVETDLLSSSMAPRTWFTALTLFSALALTTLELWATEADPAVISSTLAAASSDDAERALTCSEMLFIATESSVSYNFV